MMTTRKMNSQAVSRGLWATATRVTGAMAARWVTRKMVGFSALMGGRDFARCDSSHDSFDDELVLLLLPGLRALAAQAAGNPVQPGRQGRAAGRRLLPRRLVGAVSGVQD